MKLKELIDEGRVEMLDVNPMAAAYGIEEKINEVVNMFKKKKMHVFFGNYTGVNPDDPDDIYDLNNEFYENKNSSAPYFKYIIKEFITEKIN